MTSHSDYARTRKPKPMQVWANTEYEGYFGDDIALVLEVNSHAVHNQVRYLKLLGNWKGQCFYATFDDFTDLYKFSH